MDYIKNVLNFGLIKKFEFVEDLKVYYFGEVLSLFIFGVNKD